VLNILKVALGKPRVTDFQFILNIIAFSNSSTTISTAKWFFIRHGQFEAYDEKKVSLGERIRKPPSFEVSVFSLDAVFKVYFLLYRTLCVQQSKRSFL